MQCDYCPHKCNIDDRVQGDRPPVHGLCNTKFVRDGRIESLSYGQVTSIALDPIEKKPLRRFMPGSKILSIGFWGCNMLCPWCQNDSISRGPADYYEFTPEAVVDEAIRQIPRGNIGIAYTYNEPLTNYDFVYETAKLAHKTAGNTDKAHNNGVTGLKNVLVTNGMLADNYLEKILPYIDALNVDLKTINPENYKKIAGDLPTILNTITKVSAKSHVEVTTLIVPGFNDSEEEMKKISKTIADIDPQIPLHISRFFPAGNMRDAEPTDVGLIYRLKDIALQNLEFVYTGNC